MNLQFGISHYVMVELITMTLQSIRKSYYEKQFPFFVIPRCFVKNFTAKIKMKGSIMDLLWASVRSMKILADFGLPLTI
jgi:hypothetical protein